MIENLVIVRGAGDIATGTIHRLSRCGFNIIALEAKEPLVIRRTVAFAGAIFDNETTIEGVTAVKAGTLHEACELSGEGIVPVLIDPEGVAIKLLRPEVVVDAILAKRNLGTAKDMAGIVIGLGPGFTAGVDVHAVIETNRGHNLGRVILEGPAESNTGIPGIIAGYGAERIIRAPESGLFKAQCRIGDIVRKGQTVAYVAEVPVFSPLDGVLRGLIHSGTNVEKGLKIGDVDPRGKVEYCYGISDKARAVAGGVLEAILYHRRFKMD